MMSFDSSCPIVVIGLCIWYVVPFFVPSINLTLTTCIGKGGGVLVIIRVWSDPVHCYQSALHVSKMSYTTITYEFTDRNRNFGKNRKFSYFTIYIACTLIISMLICSYQSS